MPVFEYLSGLLCFHNIINELKTNDACDWGHGWGHR